MRRVEDARPAGRVSYLGGDRRRPCGLLRHRPRTHTARRSTHFGSGGFVRELILNSLAVIFLALLPVGLNLIEQQGPSVWRALSGLHSALIIFVAWPSLFLQVQRVESGDRDPVVYAIVVAIQLATAVLQLLNVAGALFTPSGGVYFFGILGPLAIGAIHFARLLFSRLL